MDLLGIARAVPRMVVLASTRQQDLTRSISNLDYRGCFDTATQEQACSSSGNYTRGDQMSKAKDVILLLFSNMRSGLLKSRSLR